MFDFLLKSADKGQLKGFKVTDIDRIRKFGIAANSLEMLKAKSSAKFKVRIQFFFLPFFFHCFLKKKNKEIYCFFHFLIFLYVYKID